MSQTITVKLAKRDVEFTSEVTDSDGFFFLSLLFNLEERKLLEEGRHTEAAAMLKSRYDKRLTEAGSEEERKQIEEQVNAEIAAFIYHQIDTNRQIRGAVASRLIECFPNLPPKLVFYENPNRFGIRLDVDEIMGFFVQIVGVTLAGIDRESTAEKVEPTTKSDSQNLVLSKPVKKLTAKEAEIARLKEELYELEASDRY